MESYIPLQSNLEIGLTLSFVQLPEVSDGAGAEGIIRDSIIPGGHYAFVILHVVGESQPAIQPHKPIYGVLEKCRCLHADA